MVPVKVLIVDDSTFMRVWLTNLLQDVPEIKVIGTAKNGIDALNKIKTLKPDVVTLDVEMPIMDGLQTLERIMQEFPLPVIMLSSWTKKGAAITFEAMEKGACDFIPKVESRNQDEITAWKNDLIKKILTARDANIRSLKGVRSREECLKIDIQYDEPEQEKTIVLIGCSTGGPRSLEEVLRKLPGDLPAPVVVVQHMPPKFTRLLAERLNQTISLPVKEAEQGEPLNKGQVYIAPGGYHLKIAERYGQLSARLTLDPPRKGLRPAFDSLLESMTTVTDYRKIVVFLTGMGSDGAEGLIQLKKKGHVYTIAEARETAVIFGMPKAAIETGYVDQIARLEMIAEIIHKKVYLGWT